MHGARTQCGRMEGADISTVLWSHPCDMFNFLYKMHQRSWKKRGYLIIIPTSADAEFRKLFIFFFKFIFDHFLSLSLSPSLPLSPLMDWFLMINSLQLSFSISHTHTQIHSLGTYTLGFHICYYVGTHTLLHPTTWGKISQWLTVKLIYSHVHGYLTTDNILAYIGTYSDHTHSYINT